MTSNVDNSQDVLDSRFIIERIDELKAEWSEATGDDESDYQLSQDDWSLGLGDDGAAEIVALLALAEEGENSAEDWAFGATLVRDSYFTEYAQQLAEDIGAISKDAAWPTCHIDWDAAAASLQQDYSQVDFDGVTYWVR